MTVYDTFLFNDELDMLQMRLEELADIEDLTHILVEAQYDHQGHQKPLCYNDNFQRFEPWADRIIHVVADIPGPDEKLDPWIRERMQREHIHDGLYAADAQPGDLIMLCDVDEIVSAEFVDRLRTFTLPSVMTMEMDMAMFAVDWVIPAQQEIAVCGYLSDMGQYPFGLLRANSYRKANPTLPHAGWHFSWLGGQDEITAKCDRFCHGELRDLILKGNEENRWYGEGWTWYGKNWTHRMVPPEKCLYQMIPTMVNPDDEWYPAYIRERRCPAGWFRPKD